LFGTIGEVGRKKHLFGTRPNHTFWDKGQRIDQSDGELAYSSRNAAFRVFELNRAAIARDGAVHPTQKPLALMRWCLSLVPEAQTVLDPFMGSGTTLVAARLEGRKAIGIEISERYCEAAVKRLAQKTLF
jgi:tRNA G10  N-methylase Trm11